MGFHEGERNVSGPFSSSQVLHNHIALSLPSSPTDRTSLDEQQSFGGRPSTFSRPSLKSHASCFHRKSFVGLEDDDDDPDAVEELFRGLLAIGTLGSVDAAMQKDDNANPDNKPAQLEDLQFMEQLLDQKADPTDQTVLDMPDCMEAAAAAMKEVEQFPAKGNEGAGRHSITAPIFPLQEYLIGSPVVITAPAPAEKKEQRTSLGELFQRDGGKSKGAAEEKNDDRGRMKKVPTRRRSLPQSRSSSAAGSGGANCATGPVSDTAPASGETKLHKVCTYLHVIGISVLNMNLKHV